MRVLRWLGIVLGTIVAVVGLLYFFRTDPVFMVSGKRLSGEELPTPADWSACNDHMTIAVETRVDDPHSVTTLCFVYKGDLIIPARAGSWKEWPAYVVADPRIRVKIGDVVYPARAERILDVSFADMLPSAAAKYPEISTWFDSDNPQEDVWVFRVPPG